VSEITHNTQAPHAAGITGASILLDRVTKRYPGQNKPAVDGLTLDIPIGKIVMFVGPSAAAKPLR
jgi:osmoprotectant transport system ATP-binding protein